MRLRNAGVKSSLHMSKYTEVVSEPIKVLKPPCCG